LFKLWNCVEPLQTFELKWFPWNKNIKSNKLIYSLLNNA
jgi:hypothetical protein